MNANHHMNTDTVDIVSQSNNMMLGANINDEWEMEEPNLGGRVTNMILDKMDNVVASNTSSLDYYAPLVKNQQVGRHDHIKHRRKPHRQVSVSFNNSVDVRVSLTSYKVDKKKIWYTIEEISLMKNQALCRKSPLRYSDTPIKVTEDILSSPPPPLRHSSSWNEQPIEISQLKRVHSAAAQLNRMPTNTTQDIGYNEHICELDKEVYINNEERRNSSRKRLYHYSKVMGELDRQFGDGYRQINVQELAGVSRAISSNAYIQAIERARKETTIAQAILLGNEKEFVDVPNTMLNRAA